MPSLGELPGLWPIRAAGVGMTLFEAMGELGQGWLYG